MYTLLWLAWVYISEKTTVQSSHIAVQGVPIKTNCCPALQKLPDGCPEDSHLLSRDPSRLVQPHIVDWTAGSIGIRREEELEQARKLFQRNPQKANSHPHKEQQTWTENSHKKTNRQQPIRDRKSAKEGQQAAGHGHKEKATGRPTKQQPTGTENTPREAHNSSQTWTKNSHGKANQTADQQPQISLGKANQTANQQPQNTNSSPQTDTKHHGRPTNSSPQTDRIHHGKANQQQPLMDTGELHGKANRHKKTASSGKTVVQSSQIAVQGVSIKTNCCPALQKLPDGCPEGSHLLSRDPSRIITAGLPAPIKSATVESPIPACIAMNSSESKTLTWLLAVLGQLRCPINRGESEEKPDRR
ncbi:hypothetical protein M5K25_004715 [Dendrobium thyrsiflorum]|uniref:Uncharacterized protein n=1 Tax=Dendrobium thyrsiflorum TaxID=117978 RepID=A0ABD0VFJ7_DENTH